MNTEREMEASVFVPVLYWGRESDDYNAIVGGVFKTRSAARVCLLKLLEKQGLVFFSHKKKDPKAEAKFWKRLTRLAKKSQRNLKDICHDYGDSYFLEGWEFKIERHSIV